MHKNSLDQRNKRVVDEHYALIPKADIPRSTFRRMWEHKTTGPSGYLIPLLVDEALPGDVHTCQVTIFARLSTLLFPLMDNVTVETQFFFVPARILWTNWERFMGSQDNPGDSISFTIPQLVWPQVTTGFSTPNYYYMLADYMGIPLANLVAGGTISVNTLPFRAYHKIFNDWYRDENLQNSLYLPTGDGPDTLSYQLLRRNKKHDYFTSALPSPQKGNPVTLPLAGSAPIRGIGSLAVGYGNSTGRTIYDTTGGSTGDTFQWSAAQGENRLPPFAAGAQTIAWATDGGGIPSIYADLSQVTASTINALRLAVQTQKLLERDARGGTRYTESLQSHWGVHPQDSRLQRAEYIGGGVSSVQTAAIAQTAPSGTTPFAGLGGQGVATGEHHYTCVAQEHGYILGLVSLMTRPTYQEGVDKLWLRSTRYDFAWPEFAALGEQTITEAEIYAQGSNGVFPFDASAFGYQERYAEYRFKNSRVSALFRTKNTGSISQWHLAQSFASPPTLGSTFIQETAPFSRALSAGAAADQQQFLLDALFTCKTTRALPAYGVPGSLLGTF